MQQYTQTHIEERFESLPADIKELLGSAETGETLQRIGQRNHLHVDQLSLLNDITVLTMIGLEPRTGYVDSLKEALGVPETSARLIAEEVNRDIFEPIRASLEALHGALSATKDAPTPQELPHAEEPPMPSREDLLREIENPTPTPPSPTQMLVSPTPAPVVSPATPPIASVVAPTMRIPEPHMTPSIAPENLPIAPTEHALSAQPGASFLDQKLAGTVHIPSETTTEKTKSLFTTPQTSTDPYRESVDAD